MIPAMPRKQRYQEKLYNGKVQNMTRLTKKALEKADTWSSRKGSSSSANDTDRKRLKKKNIEKKVAERL